MNFPESIKIAGYDIKVEKMLSEEGESFGVYVYFVSARRLIRINERYTDLQEDDTLLHEVMHANCWAYNIHDEHDEERVVTTMALGMMQVMRDNPMLWVYFGAAICEIDFLATGTHEEVGEELDIEVIPEEESEEPTE